MTENKFFRLGLCYFILKNALRSIQDNMGGLAIQKFLSTAASPKGVNKKVYSKMLTQIKYIQNMLTKMGFNNSVIAIMSITGNRLITGTNNNYDNYKNKLIGVNTELLNGLGISLLLPSPDLINPTASGSYSIPQYDPLNKIFNVQLFIKASYAIVTITGIINAPDAPNY